jgi:hypothetical protein
MSEDVMEQLQTWFKFSAKYALHSNKTTDVARLAQRQILLGGKHPGRVCVLSRLQRHVTERYTQVSG